MSRAPPLGRWSSIPPHHPRSPAPFGVVRHERTAGLSNPAWNVGVFTIPGAIHRRDHPILTESTVGMIE